jgi:hypothetical protein
MKNDIDFCYFKGKKLTLNTYFSLTDPFRFLYPEKLEYSYIPRNILANNKSRLDFFIISDSLLDCVTDCNIAPNLQNKLFDHRAISLTFNQNRTLKARKTFRISNYSINDDLLRYLVHATVAETYAGFLRGVIILV